jgi:hypothetical protein
VGVDELCSNLIGSGNQKITKDDFNEEVDFREPILVIHMALTQYLSKYSGRVLQLLTYGAYPNFTQEE